MELPKATSDPKVPDDNRNWEAMDIFLFNNGQDSTPPRKYHLDSYQLDWWKLTLSQLAKAQFGEVHNEIALYTIDGTKIDNPLQLSNGTAYVAVLPPEDFIEAGYEKYLVKATRSWEKSQLRKESSIVVIKPDEVAENRESDIKVISTVIPPLEDVALNTIIKSNSINNNSTTLTIKSNIERPNLQRLSQIPTPNIKLVQDRKTSNQPPARRLSSQPNAIKTAFKRRDSGNGKQNSVKISTVRDNKASSSISQDATKALIAKGKQLRPISKSRASAPDPLLTKIDEKKISTVEAILKEETANELYNVNYESPQKHFNNVETPFYPEVIEIPEAEAVVCDIDNSKKDTPTQVISYTSEKETVVNNPLREDIVNVNLNIEICNHGNNSIYKINGACDGQNIIKLEKASQPELVTECFDKSLYKEIEKELNASKKDSEKIVVVKCSCLCRSIDDSKSKEKAEIKSDNKEYFILLPILQLDPELRRCKCKSESDKASLNKLHSFRTSSVVAPPRKTPSCTSLINVLSVVETTENSCDMNQLKHTDNQHKEINEQYKDMNQTESVLSKRKSVVIHTDEGVNPKSNVSITNTVNIDRSRTTLIQNDSVKSLPCCVEKSTQTDWQNILLEAKLEEDGHYSFHLPALESLKKFNKIYTK